MNARRLFAGETDPTGEGTPDGAPLGGTRSEAAQRLQVGLFGIFAMVLLVGLASIIGSQADLAEESAVPDAAPTTEPTAPPAQRDPLADAGVVPPSEPEPSPVPPGEIRAIEEPPLQAPRLRDPRVEPPVIEPPQGPPGGSRR